MKQCLRTLVLLIRRTVFTIKRRASTQLFDLHGYVPVQILTHEPMSVCSFEHNFPLLRLMRRVSTRRDNVQFFCAILTYEDVSRCKFSHRRMCMYATFHIRNHVTDHWFDPREGLWCVFTVKNVPLRNFVTYMDVSACKFSHERTCLYATCPIIAYVWARPTCFHAVCRLQDVFMRVFTH